MAMSWRGEERLRSFSYLNQECRWDQKNIRPISLTSSLGNVAEHVIHNCISGHIEDEGLFRLNMVSFCKSLLTENAMLLIKRAILDNTSLEFKMILAVDLRKAFHTLKHEHILNEVSKLSLGEEFSNFVKSFLADRKATISMSQIKSKEYTLGNVGKP